MPEKSEWPRFKVGEKAGEVLSQWWRELADHRGDRADLRRTAELLDVIFNPAYHRLRVRLLAAGCNINNEKLAVVTGLVARVKEDNSAHPVARQMAEIKSGDRPRVSELRFRRLLETKGSEELFLVLVRALPLVGDSANLMDLADSAYGWNDYQRKRWALEYYSGLPEKASKP